MPRNLRPTVTITGITQTTSGRTFSGMFQNAVAYPSGIFGYSVTSYTTVNGSNWAIDLFTKVTGTTLKIAGVTGIGSTTSGIIPINLLAGTTTSNFIGIPLPDQINVIGSSTGVGSTFSVVVTGALYTGG